MPIVEEVAQQCMDRLGTGRMLAQVKVPVRANDTAETLEVRVKEAERKLIVTTLGELANRREAS